MKKPLFLVLHGMNMDRKKTDHLSPVRNSWYIRNSLQEPVRESPHDFPHDWNDGREFSP